MSRKPITSETTLGELELLKMKLGIDRITVVMSVEKPRVIVGVFTKDGKSITDAETLHEALDQVFAQREEQIAKLCEARGKR